MTKAQRTAVNHAAVRWLSAEDASQALARVQATDLRTPEHVEEAIAVVRLWLRAVKGDEMGTLLQALGGFDGPTDALLAQWRRHIDETVGLMDNPSRAIVADIEKGTA